MGSRASEPVEPASYLTKSWESSVLHQMQNPIGIVCHLMSTTFRRHLKAYLWLAAKKGALPPLIPFSSSRNGIRTEH